MAAKRLQRLGIFTVGGDRLGLNAVIRAVVRSAPGRGLYVTGILAASPKESVLAEGGFGKPEGRASLLAEGLLERIWQAICEKIQLVGEDRLGDSKIRLVEEVSRFYENVDEGDEYIALLSNKVEEVLFEMVGRRHGRWDFWESQKLRSILADF